MLCFIIFRCTAEWIKNHLNLDHWSSLPPNSLKIKLKANAGLYVLMVFFVWWTCNFECRCPVFTNLNFVLLIFFRILISICCCLFGISIPQYWSSYFSLIWHLSPIVSTHWKSVIPFLMKEKVLQLVISF